ncbi:MAG: hypothetical protein RL748_3961, partial [Pseudomonadota bacterium]
MQIEKLVLDLHPRSNSQALDLGFSLLSLNASQTWLSWLALWLPLMLLLCLLALLMPDYAYWFMLLGWWLRPLLERAPLYVLSRAVFGEQVKWSAAVRAWPRQLAGGWFYMLILRPLMLSRCLGQPIWQLEGARRGTAAERYRVISRNNAGTSAGWFGVACWIFEWIIFCGAAALLSLFISQTELVNPFKLLWGTRDNAHSVASILLLFGLYTLAVSVMAPIYTACGLTLYLNRRATLEAWDIELVLRQIHAPVVPGAASSAVRPLMALLALPLFVLLQSNPLPARAADDCTPLARASQPDTRRGAAQTPQQRALRDEVAKIYQDADLRDYRCKVSWALKKKYQPTAREAEPAQDYSQYAKLINSLAGFFKVLIIVLALSLLAYFLYRYRDQFAGWMPQARKQAATEVAGLDIRPESLPKSVADAVRKLWQQQEQRAALALLYRATLSRLVSLYALEISRGATEG